MNLIDTHAHLHDEKFNGEVDSIVANAKEAGISTIINAGTCIKTTAEAIAVADKYDSCYALAGIHPHDASSFEGGETLASLAEFLKHPKVLGIGEIGLDYHYDFSPRAKQKEAFIAQWNLAVKTNVPVVLHVREAYDDFFAAIDQLEKPEKAILHCFSGDMDIARKAMDMGFHFSIGGVLTYPKADETRNVFQLLPLDKIHLETDCPYLAPKPKRGKRNEPALLIHTFRYLAELRGINEGDLAKQLAKNALDLFSVQSK